MCAMPLELRLLSLLSSGGFTFISLRFTEDINVLIGLCLQLLLSCPASRRFPIVPHHRKVSTMAPWLPTQRASELFDDEL